MRRSFRDMLPGWGVAETTPEAEGLIHGLREGERQLPGAFGGLVRGRPMSFCGTWLPTACPRRAAVMALPRSTSCASALALRGGLVGGPERLALMRARTAHKAH